MDEARAYGAVLNEAFLDLIGSHARLLDVGCGTGLMGAALKRRAPCHVTGLTLNPVEAQEAATQLDRVLVRDLESWDPRELEERFDGVLLCHVLEHLVDPWESLRRFVEVLSPGGRVYVALPNLMFLRSRARLLLGRFRYEDYGLMCRSHLRWFDGHTARELITQAGLRLEHASADGHLPQPWLRRLMPGVAKALDRAASRAVPGLFGHQYLLVGARP